MAASTSVGDLCRLCGTDTLNIVRNAIFEGEGRVKKYALKISECLTLQVTQEDRLPKIMCGECTYKLDLISDFRDKAFKTETLLISKLDLDVVKPEIPDEDDGPDLNNDDVGGDDFHSSSPEPPIEPEVVVKEEDHAVEKRPGRKAATKRSMRESESEEEEEEAPAKKRGRKPKETPTATATAPVAAPPKENTGLQPESLSELAVDPGRRLLIGTPVFSCRYCGSLFESRALARHHISEEHKNKGQSLSSDANGHVRCCVCLQMCVSRAAYRVHLRLHVGEVPMECATCFELFANRRRLEHHMQRKHLQFRKKQARRTIRRSKPPQRLPVSMQVAVEHRCQDCNMKFRRRDDVRAHRRKAHAFNCICGFSCYSQAIMAAHKKRSHPDWKFPCRKCGENFSQMMDMAAHMDASHPAKYNCKKCGLATDSCVQMLQHRRDSCSKDDSPKVEPKPTKMCSICSLNCPGRVQLQQHMKKHGRPFECAECHQIALTQEKATEHAQMHADVDAPFHCSVCKLNFQHHEWASKHVEAYHGKKGRVMSRNSRICPLCLLPDAGNVSQHLLDKHVALRSEPQSCVRCDYKANDLDDLLGHTRTAHNVIVRLPEQCPVCKNVVVNQYNLTRHLSMVHPLCPYCDERQATRAVFMAHVSAKHPGKAPPELLRPKILQPKVEVKTEPVDPEVSPPPAVPPPLPAATGTAIPSTPEKKRGRPPGSANKNSPRKLSSSTKSPPSPTKNPPSPKKSPAPLNLSSTPDEAATPSPSVSFTSKWMRRRKCPECNVVLNTVSDLKKHLMNQHFRCARCDLLFANLTQLQQHACQVPTYRCPVLVCSKKMAAAQVHFHVARWHQGEPVCCVCLVMLDSMQQLEQHQVNMHPGEVSKCPQCGDLVKTGYMKKHVQMKHWKDRPHFGCSECSKTFRSKSGLDAHIRWHTGEHHFACPWCPEDFQLLAQLKRHLERHVEQPKMPTCSWCGAVFDAAVALMKHVSSTAACQAQRDASTLLYENGNAAVTAPSEEENGASDAQ